MVKIVIITVLVTMVLIRLLSALGFESKKEYQRAANEFLRVVIYLIAIGFVKGI